MNADGTTTENTYTSGDRSVFVDNGNAYLVYVGDSLTTRNVDINVAPLDATWQNVGKPVITRPIGGHEAPPGTPTDSFGTQFEQIIPVTDAQGVVQSPGVTCQRPLRSASLR